MRNDEKLSWSALQSRRKNAYLLGRKGTKRKKDFGVSAFEKENPKKVTTAQRK